MVIKKITLITLFILSVVVGCKNDDDSSNTVISQPRDLTAQAALEDERIISYLKTHTFNRDEFDDDASDFEFKFDTITDTNPAAVPMMVSLESETDAIDVKEVVSNGVLHKYYVLNLRPGDTLNTGTVADSIFTTYVGRGMYFVKDDDGDGIPNVADLNFYTDSSNLDTDEDGIIDNYDADLDNDGLIDSGKTDDNGNGMDDKIEPTDIFDSAVTPVWFDLLSGVIPGFAGGLEGFGGSASDGAPGIDGIKRYDEDYGVGAVLFPSGIGYFNVARTGIPSYSTLIFTFKTLQVKASDHDGDGVSTKIEALDSDGKLLLNDTDDDGVPDYLDVDDDNDGVFTKVEIRTDTNGDGEITLADTVDVPYKDIDNDEVPNYLDSDEQ